MVLPIVGPENRTQVTLGPANPLGFQPEWVIRVQQRYKQAPPFSLALPYEAVIVKIETFTAASGQDANPNQIPSWTHVNVDPPTLLIDQARNRAYDDWKDGLGEAASLAVSLAERRQTMDMLTARLGQLARFGSAILRRRFGDAADALGVSRKRLRGMNLRKGAKSAASNYLEFHFGWSPLIGDIGSAMKVLQHPIPNPIVRGKARLTSEEVYRNPDPWWYRQADKFRIDVRCQAAIGVTNPNLWLANQLGFVNPATVVWELVPFSFVLDWFVNVEQFLSQFTDTVGLQVIDPQYTTFEYSRRTFNQYDGYAYSGYRIRVVRRIGQLPPVTLRPKAPWKLSPRRGLAAASLLVQQLKTIKG